VVELTYLRLFRYSDLCRCSKLVFRCIASWGLEDIEKDFVDVSCSILVHTIEESVMNDRLIRLIKKSLSMGISGYNAIICCKFFSLA